MLSQLPILLFLASLLMILASSENATSTTTEFDWKLANISIELVDVAYCKPNSSGLLEGFKVTTGILTFNAFIGVLPSQRAIYVVFGGSSTILDWLFDLDVKLTPYSGCVECKVHQGYYLDQQITYPIVLSAVKLLQMMNPHDKVVVTGHSKGAAQATLTALALINNSIKNVNLVNFGSPRVGNEAFAVYASNKLNLHYRMTHHMDTIPNIPTRRQGYMHISGEWYEHPTLSLYECSDFEDPNCSAQWGSKLGLDKSNAEGIDITASNNTTPPLPASTSAPDWLHLLQQGAKDHMHYLGRGLGCLHGDTETTDLDQAPNLRAALPPSIAITTIPTDQTTVQQEVMRFALIVTICMLVLFCMAMYVVCRADYRRSVQSRTAATVERDSEISPLLTTNR